jgi:hypothetical protein
VFTEPVHGLRVLSRFSVSSLSPSEAPNVLVSPRNFITAARWVDPALGFAVSVWILGLTHYFSDFEAF